MGSKSTWLIYALGGGWGHLNRALALGRVAARQHQVRILVNSPYVACLTGGRGQGARVRQQGQRFSVFGCELWAMAPDASRETTCEQVRQVLTQMPYDRLIVDTFPRGLGGELVELLPQLPASLPRILVHRDLQPAYVQAREIAPFVLQQYDAVIVPGEGDRVPLAHLPITHHTAPWLIRNAEELPSPEIARSLLQLPVPQPATVVVCAAGTATEQILFGNVTAALASALPQVAVRCVAPTCPPNCPPDLWVAHYPAMDCLQIANVVVGGAGYNTVSECVALGIPLVAFAFERLYDRQAVRAAQGSYWVKDIAGAIAQTRILLNQHPPSTRPNYLNGTVEAVEHILRQSLTSL